MYTETMNIYEFMSYIPGSDYQIRVTGNACSNSDLVGTGAGGAYM